jgi:hypothetical protein
MKLLSFSSYEGISRPSPHNILCVWILSEVGEAKPLRLADVVDSTVIRSPHMAIWYLRSPRRCCLHHLQGANQSLNGPYHGSPVVSGWDRAGHCLENGIIPTTSAPLSRRFPTDPGVLDATGLFQRPAGVQKNSLRWLDRT